MHISLRPKYALEEMSDARKEESHIRRLSDR